MIVLDTHALIWWVSGDDHLSQRANEAIQTELANDGKVLVSAISAWEIALLVAKRRLALTMDVDDWLATVAAIEGLLFVPVDVAQSVQSVRLPGVFHPDPANRLIVALARHHSAPLVTADKKIRLYQYVKTIW